MKQAAHFIPVPIDKAEIFTAVDDLISLRRVFRRFDPVGKSRLIIGARDGFVKLFRPAAQSLCQGGSRAVHIIVKSAASAAGFTGIGLTKMNKWVFRHMILSDSCPYFIEQR
jgi:hypothetical protein